MYSILELLNTYPPRVCNMLPSANDTYCRDVHPEKLPGCHDGAPIVVTFLGITILIKEVQFWKA